MPLNPNTVTINDAPIGTEQGLVTRPIFRKKTFIETTTNLGNGAVFTSPWRDSELDGTVFVMASAVFTTVASASSGFLIQESDDILNASMTRTAGSGTTLLGTQPSRICAGIRARYWRVQYTNGANTNANFELTTCAMNFYPPGLWNGDVSGITLGQSSLTGQPGGPVVGVMFPGNFTSASDNSTSSNSAQVPLGGSGTAPLEMFPKIYGGAYSGTASASKQGWSRPRTSTTFKQVSTAANGSTALWTPAASNKFRLLAFKIQVTDDAAQTVAGVLTIDLLDSAATIGLAHKVYVPGAAPAAITIADYDSGWIDLGAFGYLSTAAGNVLNINLSAGLTGGGVVNVIAAGTEE